MDDLKCQFREDIQQAFSTDDFMKARLMAMEMYELSQNFVMELSPWMDAFYQELVSTSEATEDDAWEVVGTCVNKVFEVMRVPRAQVANATMDSNLISQCATYLWALFQAHRVMKEFINARFRNHGAIAPVIILHFFKVESLIQLPQQLQRGWKGGTLLWKRQRTRNDNFRRRRVLSPLPL